MIDVRPDILITDDLGQLVATIEVKNIEHLTAELATTLRQTLASHGHVPRAPYYLLVSQDVGYLWKDVSPQDTGAPPDRHFPLTSVIERYLGTGPMRRLGETELTFVLAQWLILLTMGDVAPTEEPERTLTGIGFSSQIRGGLVELGAAL